MSRRRWKLKKKQTNLGAEEHGKKVKEAPEGTGNGAYLREEKPEVWE